MLFLMLLLLAAVALLARQLRRRRADAAPWAGLPEVSDEEVCSAIRSVPCHFTATAGPHISIKAQLYLNTGTYGSPTWSAVTLAGDLDLKTAWEKGAADIRGNRLKQYLKTMLDVPLTAKVRVDYADTNFGTLFTAAMTDSILNILIIDAPITVTGAFGFWIDFQVFSNAEPLPLNGVNYMDFELMPTPTSNQQSYVVMGSSSTPTATQIV